MENSVTSPYFLGIENNNISSTRMPINANQDTQRKYAESEIVLGFNSTKLVSLCADLEILLIVNFFSD